MKTTTTNSMNILIERPSLMISAKVPARMKGLIEDAANSINMNSSQYIKLAIAERLEKDNKL
jgi:hypothetical protein